MRGPMLRVSFGFLIASSVAAGLNRGGAGSRSL
jgi:hypothetical protein